jgi:hypothetical protein
MLSFQKSLAAQPLDEIKNENIGQQDNFSGEFQNLLLRDSGDL